MESTEPDIEPEDNPEDNIIDDPVIFMEEAQISMKLSSFKFSMTILDNSTISGFDLDVFDPFVYENE